MSYKVKIFGAGSIGNHLANASRSLGWDVTICDVDPEALRRTKEEIYPSRYGLWDDDIKLHLNDDAPKGNFDIIFIGTPPDHHNSLALSALEELPKAILVEKPFCTPSLKDAQTLSSKAEKLGVSLFVGYDHVVGLATRKVAELIAQNIIGNVETLDVEFREHWGGIFNAHPWLAGPQDSYLGYWERGGGACGEHSHALNLWQHFAHLLCKGKVSEVSATMDMIEKDTLAYDKIAAINLTTERDFKGRVIQDVVTKPTRKWARIQGTLGAIEWVCGSKPGTDTVYLELDDKNTEAFHFSKTRPDDFIAELSHIKRVLNNKSANPQIISGQRGLETMMVISAAYKSHFTKNVVNINYSSGFDSEALTQA
ncbi:Gfo/Idh/MocA family protein [Kiloniella sp. EL199]|uniref:Gfo/Idh/MocA family protein n=1 Tax=Kiloniella sp. EL199 TaxID=2107581 RepID=UPI000EA1DAF6|nr:Gfo/Idh/MocA family oxidoreductase [Kiloniella sp. EL199]